MKSKCHIGQASSHALRQIGTVNGHVDLIKDCDKFDAAF
jgi:hypothetical protein